MKNLIVLCGKYPPDTDLKPFTKYIPFDLKECDVIVTSDKEQDVAWLKCNNLIQVSVIDDCNNDKIFSYKCLEYANHEKDKYELYNNLLYDLCFFVDVNDINKFDFPKEFIYPHDRSIVTFDSKKLDSGRFRPTGKEYVTIVSTSCWYSNSIIFSVISKYYKGNQFLNNKEKWERTFVNEFERENRSEFLSEELTFFNYIRKVGFTFIYAN